MDIEKLIECIKKRLLMFIRELNFDYLSHFLSGFLCYSMSIQEINNIDKIFKQEFHNWAKKWIEKNKNISFDEQRGYSFYIKSVCKTQQECFDLFFDMCAIFFNEIHSKTD